jgi:enoyl-CoA hydratase
MRDYATLSLNGPDSAGVMVLTLNRPAAGNSVDEAMHREISDVLRTLRSSADIGALVVTGAGGQFCSGGDGSMLQPLMEDERFSNEMFEESVHLVMDWLRVRPPVVAAISGAALGLGATLGLLCDIVVMDDDAVLADTHIHAGVVPGDGGTFIWPLLIGPNRAKELLMTGEMVDAATAHRLGLVNHVTPSGGAFQRSYEIAQKLAAGPRTAIAWTKQCVNATMLREAALQLPMSIAFEARTFFQRDVNEAIAAFGENRAPRWPSGLPTPRS